MMSVTSMEEYITLLDVQLMAPLYYVIFKLNSITSTLYTFLSIVDIYLI